MKKRKKRKKKKKKKKKRISPLFGIRTHGIPNSHFFCTSCGAINSLRKANRVAQREKDMSELLDKERRLMTGSEPLDGNGRGGSGGADGSAELASFRKKKAKTVAKTVLVAATTVLSAATLTPTNFAIAWRGFS